MYTHYVINKNVSNSRRLLTSILKTHQLQQLHYGQLGVVAVLTEALLHKLKVLQVAKQRSMLL